MSTSALSIILGSESPLMSYSPFRDGNMTQGWNASYTGSTTYHAGSIGTGMAYRSCLNSPWTAQTDVELVFRGTAVALCTTVRLNDSAILSVEDVNGQILCQVLPDHPHCGPFPETTVEYYCGNLTEGSYIATLSFWHFSEWLPTGEDFFDVYGAVITDNIPTSYKSVWIDDRDPNWTYATEQGGNISQWSKGSLAGDYMQTHTYTCNPSDWAAYNFNGAYTLQLLGIVNYNSSVYSIAFEEVSSSESTYAVFNGSSLWLSTNQTLFSASGLNPSSNYSLLIMNWNNTALEREDAGGCLFLDALLLYTSDSVNNSSSSTLQNFPTSFPAKTIAGLVAGVAFAVAALVGASFCIWRRASKRAERAARLEAVEAALRQVPEPFLNSGSGETDRVRAKGRLPSTGLQSTQQNLAGPSDRTPRPVGPDYAYLSLVDWDENDAAPPEYTSERARPATEEEGQTALGHGSEAE